jgi:hypothetical protein
VNESTEEPAAPDLAAGFSVEEAEPGDQRDSPPGLFGPTSGQEADDVGPVACVSQDDDEPWFYRSK